MRSEWCCREVGGVKKYNKKKNREEKNEKRYRAPCRSGFPAMKTSQHTNRPTDQL